MKDFSSFFQNSYGFITKYEIVGDEIHVYTAQSEKGEPHKYPATKEWIEYLEKRLENQYRMLVCNKIVFKEEIIGKKISKINVFSIILGVIFTIISLLFVFNQSFLFIPFGTITLGSLILGNRAIVNKLNKDYDLEMSVIESYLNNRETIERVSKEDKNITNYLSFKADKRISENNRLMDQNLLDSIFNIDFMDKTKLKDLKKLLTRFYIIEGIKSEQKVNSKVRKKM